MRCLSLLWVAPIVAKLGLGGGRRSISNLAKSSPDFGTYAHPKEKHEVDCPCKF